MKNEFEILMQNENYTLTVKILKSISCLNDRENLFIKEFSDRHGYYFSKTWFDNLYKYTIDKSFKNEIYIFYINNKVAFILFLVSGNIKKMRFFNLSFTKSLTSEYTVLYAPIIGNKIPDESIINTVSRYFSKTRKFDTMMIEKISGSDKVGECFFNSLGRKFGYCYNYFNYINRYEFVGGKSFSDYLSGRQSKFLNDLKRRKKRLAEAYGDLCFEVVDDVQAANEALNKFTLLYEKTWKGYENCPEFVRSVCLDAAELGVLRIYLLYTGNKLVAGKLCFLEGGVLSMFKAAFDPDYRKYAPGDIVNYLTIEHCMKNYLVNRIDFGVGDEPYKGKWVSEKSEIRGLVSFNRYTIKGQLAGISSKMVICIKNKTRLLSNNFSKEG